LKGCPSSARQPTGCSAQHNAYTPPKHHTPLSGIYTSYYTSIENNGNIKMIVKMSSTQNSLDSTVNISNGIVSLQVDGSVSDALISGKSLLPSFKRWFIENSMTLGISLFTLFGASVAMLNIINSEKRKKTENLIGRTVIHSKLVSHIRPTCTKKHTPESRRRRRPR